MTEPTPPAYERDVIATPPAISKKPGAIACWLYLDGTYDLRTLIARLRDELEKEEQDNDG